MKLNPRFTRAEELANAISHLTGALMGVAGLVLMVVFSAIHGSGWHVVSSSIFGFTIVLLYLSSTLNHWLPPGRSKNFFFNFDQVAIFLLIAGTYTPFALVALNGALGWTIFGIEWGLAITGILVKILKPNKFEAGVNVFFILVYILMGWLVLIAIVPVIRVLPLMGLIWLFLGGLLYTFGTLIYKLSKFRFHHLIWHLFVIAGTISHFFAVYFYVLPLKV